MVNMKHSPVIKYLPYVLKYGMLLDVKTVQLNYYGIALKFCSTLFFAFSTYSCLSEHEGEVTESFRMFHDLWLIASVLLAIDCFIAGSKHKLQAMFEFLAQPLEGRRRNVRQDLIESYNKSVTLYGKIAMTHYVLSVLVFCLPALVTFVLSPTLPGTGCADVEYGWVRGSDYWYMLGVHLFSTATVVAELAGALAWLLIMAMVVLKLTYKIKLLRADLEDLNSSQRNEVRGENTITLIGESRNILRGNTKSGIDKKDSKKKVQFEDNVGFSPTWDEESSVMRYVKISNVYEKNNPIKKDKDANKVMRIEQINVEQKMKLSLKSIVEQHVDIIRQVKLVEETYRYQLMVHFYIGAMDTALAIPKLNSASDLMTLNTLERVWEVLGLLVVSGTLSYIGQSLINESELLRQALYNCDWPDMPLSFQRSLLIMQTVATRPLRLTLGGIHTLGMKTYGEITKATYSYISMIQSLN